MNPAKPCSLRRRFGPESSLTVRLADSIDTRNGAAWDALVASASPFLQRSYLRALQGGLLPGEALRYATFHDGEQLVGVACFQLTSFHGNPLGERFRGRPVLAFLARLLHLAEKPLAFNVLVCGNPAASGEHGFHFSPAVEPPRAMDSLLMALSTVQAELERAAPIDGVLVKDLRDLKKAVGETLARHSYAELGLEPAMVLSLDPSWDSFETYLGCLASKYRVKARRAYAKSQALQVRDLDVEDLIALQDRWMELFHAVHNKAEYRLGKPSFSMFLNLRRTLGSDFILRGYFHQGTLVGFLTGFVWQGVLEAHLVGLDYTLNQELSIYPRLLCDYLQLAIERGCHQVNYGRTAGEIKSTLGAEPVEACCYLRHRDCFPNRLTRLIAPHLHPIATPVRMPFNKEWYGLRTQRETG